MQSLTRRGAEESRDPGLMDEVCSHLESPGFSLSMVTSSWNASERLEGSRRIQRKDKSPSYRARARTQAAFGTCEMRWVMRIKHKVYVKHHSSIWSPSREAGRAYPTPGWGE